MNKTNNLILTQCQRHKKGKKQLNFLPFCFQQKNYLLIFCLLSSFYRKSDKQR